MNRREFLKGGLGGLFGALLAWAGVVEAEEAEPINVLEFDSVVKAFHNSCSEIIADVDRTRAAIEELEQSELVSDNVSWDDSTDTGDAPPEHGPCDTCACRAECNADSVYWCSVIGIETRRENNPWASELTSMDADIGDLAAKGYPCIDGIYEVHTKLGYSRWIYWSHGGSDENGDGTRERPVATEACAREIAKPRYWDGHTWDTKISHDIL